MPHCVFAAILITGGCCNDDSAEVFHPATSTSCQLPGMVERREDHTLEGLLACGGDVYTEAGHSCEEFSPATGTWALTSTLQEARYDHVSWSVEEGTLLMGGFQHETTSEIVKHDGTTETSFEMKYDTWYETNQ